MVVGIVSLSMEQPRKSNFLVPLMCSPTYHVKLTRTKYILIFIAIISISIIIINRINYHHHCIAIIKIKIVNNAKPFCAVDVLAHLSCPRSSNSPARNVGLQKGKKYCGGQGTVNWRASSYPGFIQNYWVSTSSYLRYQDTAIKSTLVIGYLDLARTKCGFAKRQKVL